MAEKKEGIINSGMWKIWLPIVIVVAAGFAVAFYKLDPPPPNHLRIASGSPDGAYFAFAQHYKKLMVEENPGLEVEIINTAGSVENLDLLARGDVDLALVQGGAVGDEPFSGLETLASLFVEPVWIFHRKEHEIHRLSDLEGLHIAIDTPGSGTRALAILLIEASGLGDGKTTLHEIPPVEAIEGLGDGIDAAIFVASIEAPYIRQLLRDEELSLLSFGRHRAYSLHFPFLSRVILGEGIVDLEENLPAQDISLLAAASSLVAQADLHEALIPLILDALIDVHRSNIVFETAGTFPSTRYIEEQLPMAPEAKIYLERGPSFLHQILGFKYASSIDRMKILLLPFITLLIPLFRVAPPLYRWRTRHQIYKWYEDLRSVDDVLHRQSSPEDVRRHIARLQQMEREISDEVSVPLSYMDEFYRLRDHIDMILTKLRRVEAESQSDPKSE